MNKLSRRSFLAGASMATVAAAGAASALADSVPSDTAMSDAQNLALTNVNGIATDPGYVIDIANGEPRWAFEIAPDPIPAEKIAETIEDDVIVIGGGMAGFVTAASAAEQGASVTLFTASATPISRGGSNFSAYNKVIEEYGIERLDPVPFFYKEMRAASYTIDQQMWMRAYNNSEEAMNWLIDLVRDKGVEVFLERDNINDGGPNYAIAFGAGDGEGSASTGQQNAVEAVAKFAEENGVKIQYNVVAKQLVKDESGAVVGVVAQNADESYVEYRGKYVVMATGGFCADKNMVAKYIPQVIPLVGTDPVDVDYNTGFALTGIYAGDGQKMGLWAGASWQKCSAAPIMQGAWSGSNEPLTFHQGLNVNMNTERYQREDISAPYAANHLITQPGHVAFGIWTANFAQAIVDAGYEWRTFGKRYETPASTADEMVATWEAGIESGSYFKADTIAELAEQLGLDAEKLQAVVDRYNELCDKGVDEDFHKAAQFLIPIEPEGPFYAARNYAMMMTVMGGLNTNCDMQVCDENDAPLPGLFNVGHMTGNMYANNYNFAIPGNCYGINCITYGYLLGHDLADGKFDA